MGASSTVEKYFAFTKTKLLELPTPKTGRDVYRDAKTPGLILRITPAGGMSFYFYRKVKGRPVRMLLGKFPDISVENARKACAAKSGEAALGKDIQAERRAARHEQTIKGLWGYWLETHAKARKRTWKEDERQYKAFLQPWANRRLSSIKKTDVSALHARIGEKNGLYAANRVLALLRAMFNKAPDMGYAGSNPTTGIKKFPEEKRDRFLHGDDLANFFAALAAETNADLRDYFLVCLFVGARKSNVLAMRWEDIDFRAGIWRIPETKSGQPVVVPLVGPVIQLLAARRSTSNGSEWVFPSYGKTGHIVEPKSAWKRIITAAGLSNVRPHDLRRSLGSWMAIQGAGLPIVGKMLGHTQPSTTAIYARLSVDHVRAAAEEAASAMLLAGSAKMEAGGMVIEAGSGKDVEK
jgi:integrase